MTFDLPIRHYCAVPSRCPRGPVTTLWRLNAARTALIELHCWNVGMPGGIPVPEEFWVFMGSPQNHERAARIVTGVIAPLLDLARRAGLPVVHVQPESVAARYRELTPPPSARPPEPALTPPAPLSQSWERGERAFRDDDSPLPGLGEGLGVRAGPVAGLGVRAGGARRAASVSGRGPISDDAARRANAVHGEGYNAWEGWGRLDVAAAVRPRPGDGMIAETEAFDRWLREREITTLLYTGFAANLCILDSPAAMKPMRERGYRCVILREATMAVEFPDTLETLAHTHAALQYIEAWVGYSASAVDLRRALAVVARS